MQSSSKEAGSGNIWGEILECPPSRRLRWDKSEVTLLAGKAWLG